GQCPSTGLFDEAHGGRELFCRTGRHGHGGSGPGEGLSDGPPDASPPPSDDSDAPREFLPPQRRTGTTRGSAAMRHVRGGIRGHGAPPGYAVLLMPSATHQPCAAAEPWPHWPLCPEACSGLVPDACYQHLRTP